MNYQVNYDNEYHYPYGSNPFAAERITSEHGSHDLKWDADGNMTWCGDGREERRMCWTEEGRLQAYWDRQRDEGVLAAYYSYDGAGERSLKLTSPRVETVQNAEAGTVSMRYATLYASPLVTINRGGYTKHYFEGSNRVCTAVGGGFGGVDWSEVEEQVPAVSGSYSWMHEMQDEGVNKAFEGCFGVGASVKGVYNLPAILEKQERWRNVAEPLHFYHCDHLGSAAYLTDRDGHVVQTLAYLPYGEDWVEQNGLGDTSRLGMYRYNGKERDGESGYLYYGARYYWSELWNGWLSVDPMVDKYPGVSPYNYCAWNPVVLVDPDGMLFDSISEIHAQNFERYTNIKITEIKKKQEKTELDIMKLNEYETALEEISKLRKDEQTWYDIRDMAEYSDKNTSGYTTYGGERDGLNVITISIAGSVKNRKGMYRLSHELKHAFQYYSGNIIYGIGDNGEISSNNNQMLEKEAYIRSYMYGGLPLDPTDNYYKSLPDKIISIDEFKSRNSHLNHIYHK